MNKKELYSEIESRLLDLDSSTFAKLLCDWFDSNELKEFVEFIKKEGYRRKE